MDWNQEKPPKMQHGRPRRQKVSGKLVFPKRKPVEMPTDWLRPKAKDHNPA